TAPRSGGRATGGSAMSAAVPLRDEVREFVGRRRPLLIGGRFGDAASGRTFPTHDPSTGEVLAQVAEGDREDVDPAVRAARTAFDPRPWSRTTPPPPPPPPSNPPALLHHPP